MDMDELKLEIKKIIISSLELEDIKPENIKDAEPLFGAGLGLDSIDALELGIDIGAIVAEASTLDRLDKLRDAYNTIIANDETKDKFKVIINALMNLYEASRPEIFEKGWHNEKFSPMAYLYGLFCHTIDDPTGPLLVEEVGMIVMANAHDHPVARLQSLPHGRPQVSIERSCRHAAEGLILHRDLASVEILVGEESPAPLTIVAVAHRAIAHGRVADEEEYGVRALPGGTRSRTVHKSLRNGVWRIVDHFFLHHWSRQVVEPLRHRSEM